MTCQYVSVEEAIGRPGLRMVVVGGVPSPWGEAAKGIFHVKKIDWTAVRLVYDSEALHRWAGQRSGPVAIYGDEPPRSGWAEILELAERLAPQPRLLPEDPGPVLELSRQILGEGGLAWSRRLQLIHAGLQSAGGFHERVAKYLAKKYGYSPEAGAGAGARVREHLAMLAGRLKETYYFGTLTAADVYSATCMALFDPLPEAQCRMEAGARAAFTTLDPETKAALDPVLLRHRDMMYARHLELPLSL